MRINNVQRSEIITTNRKEAGIGRSIAFQSKAKNVKNAAKTASATVQPLLSQDVIDHFGLNITTAVKYNGKPSYTPAPETLNKTIKDYFHRLEIDWDTHIDPAKPKKRFE